MKPLTCICPLEDGRSLTIRASLRPLHGAAAIKCQLAAPDPAWQFTQQVQRVVQLARLHEAAPNESEQLLLEFDSNALGMQAWEVAVILLDRLLRGVYVANHLSHFQAAGQIIEWQQGLCAPNAIYLQDGIEQNITHLAQLALAPNKTVIRQQRVYFPLIGSGAHDCLSWLEVWARAEAKPVTLVANVLGLDVAQQAQALEVLQAARSHEAKNAMYWRSVLHFAPTSFVGNSWQLALVLADRIARGRAFAPRGRLLATGCSSRWAEGVVESVAGCAEKSTLLLQEVSSGDRIILPAAWQAQQSSTWLQEIQAKGASCVYISQLGLW